MAARGSVSAHPGIFLSQLEIVPCRNEMYSGEHRNTRFQSVRVIFLHLKLVTSPSRCFQGDPEGEYLANAGERPHIGG